MHVILQNLWYKKENKYQKEVDRKKKKKKNKENNVLFPIFCSTYAQLFFSRKLGFPCIESKMWCVGFIIKY